MASITLKDIPEDLHAQLKSEAQANFRSVTQEALARIERSFAIQDALTTGTVNRLIDESLASGPEEKFSWAQFNATRTRARAQFAAKQKAA